MKGYAIEVDSLTKKFGKFTAVDKISFKVKKGEMFGLLGPNGAGKTTTINMLSTLLNPTSGKATVNGYDVKTQHDDVRKSIGVVFQATAVDNQLTGRENLEFHAMMYKLESKEIKKRVKEVLELVDLQDKADIITEKYSGGMMRRLEIARGLIHHPKVLFLDEPTLGLDAQTRRHIWEYIKKLNKKEGVTVILTTHYMEEADFLCERIAIIDNGKIIIMNTPQKLKNTLGGDVISLEIKKDGVQKLLDCLKSYRWIKKIKEHDGFVDLSVSKGEQKIPAIASDAEKCGVKLASVSLRKPSLEDVFLHYTGRTIREQEADTATMRHMMWHRRA